MAGTTGTWRDTGVLAAAGGLGFWVTNLAISLTPLAAEYRSAMSIAYVAMLVEALLGGVVLGFCVGHLLLRFSDRLPTKTSMSKALVLSTVALAVVTLLVEVPAKSFASTSDPVRYFFIALLFNALRILGLGVAIGYTHGRMEGGASTDGAGQGDRAHRHHS